MYPASGRPTSKTRSLLRRYQFTGLESKVASVMERPNTESRKTCLLLPCGLKVGVTRTRGACLAQCCFWSKLICRFTREGADMHEIVDAASEMWCYRVCSRTRAWQCSLLFSHDKSGCHDNGRLGTDGVYQLHTRKLQYQSRGAEVQYIVPPSYPSDLRYYKVTVCCLPTS